MAKYTPPRPGTLGRCLPLYFGQDFAREQRIGNPAALAACCRSFSGWWPLNHSPPHFCILSMETCIESAYEFAKNNRRAVYHIYNSIDRNAYEDFLMRMCAHTARLVVGEMTPDGKIAPEDRDALIYFAKCQFFGLCMDWTKSGMNDNIVEKYRRAVRLLTDMSHGE